MFNTTFNNISVISWRSVSSLFTISEYTHLYVRIIKKHRFVCSHFPNVHMFIYPVYSPYNFFFGITVEEKGEVIKRLGFFGIVFFLLSIAFMTIGGIGINTSKKEHEWDSRFSSQIFCGSLVAGVLVNIRFEKFENNPKW